MIEKHFSEKLLLGAIIISMFIWGLSWPSGKILINYLSPVNFVICRYLLVVSTLFPILAVLKVPLKGNKQGVPYILSSGILLAFYSFLFYNGLKHGLAGAGGVLVTTLNPIMAYSIGIALTRRWPSRNETTGLLLGLLAGCILLKVWSQTGGLLDSGNLFFLAAAFTWAVMSKITSKASSFGSSLSFTLWQYFITLLCILPFLNVHEFLSIFSISDKVFWLNLFFSSAIVTTLATTVYFYATAKLGPEKASSFIFLVPFAAETSSWLFLKESILINTVIGGIIGIAAVYLINRKYFSRKTSFNSDSH